MKNKVLVIAPHPDDEILGCGGTLLRRKKEGAELCWVIVTNISESEGWDKEQVCRRNEEIDKVREMVGFNKVYNLGFAPAKLDTIPLSLIIGKLSGIFSSFQPHEVFLPHYSDVHTDHHIVFNATTACTKWFRYPSVKKVLSYETISETEFGLKPEQKFNPNVYVDIGDYLDKKIQLMRLYKTEIGDFPFPRSEKAIRAKANYRGSSSGYDAAEAFCLLSERQ